MDTLAPLTCAAVATATTLYPVDVVRAMKMTNSSVREFYQKFGLKGFASQGILPEVVRASAMRVSKFFFFPIVCEFLWHSKPSETSPLKKGIAGAFATVPEILVISPMEVAKLGLQLDKEQKYRNNALTFIKEIYAKRGVRGLYVGWAGMQYRQSSWTGAYFATLASFRDKVNPALMSNGFDKGAANLLSGFCAGYFAALFNTPGDMVRSVVQKRAFTDGSFNAYGIHPYGFVEHIKVAGEMVRIKGPVVLYSGFGVKGVQLGLSGAFMAFFIPMFQKMLGIKYDGI